MTAKSKAKTACLISGLGGLLFGLFSGIYIASRASHPENASPQKSTDNSTEIANVIKQLEARVAELQEANSRLRAHPSQAAERTGNTASDRSPEDEFARRKSRERMLTNATARHETVREQQLYKLKFQTSATPEQMEIIEEIMKDRDQLEVTLLSMISDGGYSEAEIQKAREELEAIDLQAYLKRVLSEEQYTSYETFEKDKLHAQKESRAAQQLGNMAQIIPLTDEQKDKLYQNFYYDDPEKQNLNKYFSSGEFDTDAYVEAQTEALRDVLTQEQIQIYEQQLRFDAKMQFGRPLRSP